ncbi:MAG: 3-deoxy-D-manno-octulosonic acid transferase [Opitutaceae bacterium]|nr:3-deoxy-D-manno-octulosonic acid transferase [Opitutaceae bacterium]
MFIWFYRLIFAPIALILSPKYLLKMKRRGDYQGAIAMRMGIGVEEWPRTEGKRRIWIQAVSLGEILVIERFIRELAARPDTEILLTTTTSTGLKMAREKYSDLCDRITYFPMDFWPFSKRFWKRMRPDLAICAETELWPEHMKQASLVGSPMVLINGRLSDKSFRYARRLSFLFGRHLRCIDQVLAISEHDAARFREIGIPAERVSVTGNLKVDVDIDERFDERERAHLKQSLGLGDGFVLLGSSTWPGEEATLLRALRALRESLPDSRLMLVPRHAERRGEIRDMLVKEASDLRWHFKSEGPPETEVDILVGDTSGELRALTQLADLAFIGKSLPPHREGQTPIECGLLGVPLLFGPGMSNFRSVRDGMLESGAAELVQDEEALISRILSLAVDGPALEALSNRQRDWAENSRGSLERTLEALGHFL